MSRLHFENELQRQKKHHKHPQKGQTVSTWPQMVADGSDTNIDATIYYSVESDTTSESTHATTAELATTAEVISYATFLEQTQAARTYIEIMGLLGGLNPRDRRALRANVRALYRQFAQPHE